MVPMADLDSELAEAAGLGPIFPILLPSFGGKATLSHFSCPNLVFYRVVSSWHFLLGVQPLVLQIVINVVINN
jgi:hypothetical protein